MPHQEDALRYLQKNNGGALFMEMRLGKTLVVIRFAKKRKFKRVLVVAPVEGLWAWQRELDLEGENADLLVGTREQRINKLWSSSQCWKLINYEGVLSIHEDLSRVHWDAIVLDESRRVANPKAKTSKAILHLPRHGECRMVLSGEPAPEGPLEYFNQFAFLTHSFLGSSNFWQFRNAFFREVAPHEWLPFPNRLERLKQGIREAAFFLNRKQAGIPDRKIYELRTLRFPPPIQKMYKGILDDFVASLDGKLFNSTKWVPVQYMWLHQLASGFLGEQMVWPGKVNQLLELLQGELRHEQVVVWFKFNAPLHAAAKALTGKKVTNGLIIGEETRAAREATINRFRRGELRVLLCQVKCGKTAIDLSNSSTAIYFANSYSLEERRQSEDRILNPKKREPLLYLDLVTEQSVEEDLVEVLKSKAGESRFYMSQLISKLQRSVLA